MSAAQHNPERDIKPWERQPEHVGRIKSLAPHYWRFVPKEPAKNARWRSRVYREAASDRSMQRSLWQMCANDVLFWASSFAMLHEPRGKGPTDIPFVPFPFQEWAVLDIHDALTGAESGRQHDLIIEKSRELGATWMVLLCMMHRFLFGSGQSFLLFSAKEANVDDDENPSALMPKIDMVLSQLPMWMQPTVNRRRLFLKNRDSGGVFYGAATVGDVGRSGRTSGILADEMAFNPHAKQAMASTGSVTDCRIMLSTPNGMNFFSELRHSGFIPVMTLHWSMDPRKVKNFRIGEDGKPTSDFYERELARMGGDKRQLAQEQDIDYGGSDYRFFDKDMQDDIAMACTSPVDVGDFDYVADTGKPVGFKSREGGMLSLWCATPGGRPPQDRSYWMGVDISSGTGASNSVASVFDQYGEQVAEYSASRIDPTAFADLCVALFRWFNNRMSEGKMIWEQNGPGRPFGNRVVHHHLVRDVYYRTDETKLTRQKQTHPGWHANPKAKNDAMYELRRALGSGECILKSKACAEELGDFITNSSENVVHRKAHNNDDPTGARSNHGDRVTAAMLAWWVVLGAVKRQTETPIEPPFGSMAYFEKMEQEHKHDFDEPGAASWRVEPQNAEEGVASWR